MSNLKYDKTYLVSKLAMMRIKGKSTHNLIEFLMNDIGMCRPTAYVYLQEAQALIVEQMSKDVKVALAESVARLEELYDSGDKKLKLDVQKELNKLRGLYEADKIDITSGGQSITEIKLIQILKKDDIDNGKD